MTTNVAVDIRLLSKIQLTEQIIALGQPRFRADQVWQWLWQKGARSFEEMSNLSKPFRQTLSEHFLLRPIVEDKLQRSSDGTLKIRYTLHDGHKIESVLIPVSFQDRYTVCVSSQVGCSLTCTFCATGRMGRLRNLDPGEIVDQVVMVNRHCEAIFGHPLTNIVYMGMGEPLLTYNNVMESIYHITSEEGLNMSPKRITLSTAGIAKMIRKLADDNTKVNLALSLHAADDVKRDTIMPINEHNNLATLMDALEYFYKKTGNRLSYEYIAFQGFNDSVADAALLAKLCRRFPVRVNIIEYNAIENAPLARSTDSDIDAFADALEQAGVTATIRRSRGKDIDAACGQLANKE